MIDMEPSYFAGGSILRKNGLDWILLSPSTEVRCPELNEICHLGHEHRLIGIST